MKRLKFIDKILKKISTNKYIMLVNKMEYIKRKNIVAKGDSIVTDMLILTKELIKAIQNKINANNYILLQNIEYLKYVNMFAELVYTLIYNRKDTFNLICVIIKHCNNIVFQSLKNYYIFFLKILLSMMIEYVKNNDEFYITEENILQFFKKFFIGTIYLGKLVSGIYVLLCFFRYV